MREHLVEGATFFAPPYTPLSVWLVRTSVVPSSCRIQRQRWG